MVPFADNEVESALERIFASDTFKSSPKLRNFLQYIVTQKLAGNEDQLKAYSIAIDVFDHSADFDPQADPIVRVQARRLRNALKEYYLEEGANEPIRITVPTGGYKPEFEVKGYGEISPEETIQANAVEKPAKSKFRIRLSALATLLVLIGLGFGWNYWDSQMSANGLNGDDSITVMIQPSLQDLTEINENENALLFFQNLRSIIARNSALSIILPNGSEAGNGNADGSDFVVNANILGLEGTKSFSVELLNGHTSRLLWSRVYKLSELNDDSVLQVVRELNSQIFGASVQALEGRDPRTLSASQLFVLATWVPGPAKSTLEWEKERVALARMALEKDDEFGPAYSVLADKLAYLAAVDGPSDTPAAAKEAKASAARAIELSASDVNSLFNVAQYYWHSGQLDSAIAMMKRVLEIDPSHGFARFFSIVIPYSCSPAPDDVVAAAEAFDQSLGTDNPARWVTLTWLGWLHLNREEFSQALEAEEYSAQIFQIPYTVMRRAAVLNLLGRTGEAANLLSSKKSSWPNISPTHFADVTFPRICSQRDNAEPMIGYYKKLEAAIKAENG